MKIRPTLSTPENFLPLEQIKRPTLSTEEAAYYLNRRPQTLRTWAMRSGSGPISCIRLNGRLAWPVAAIRAVLEGAQ